MHEPLAVDREWIVGLPKVELHTHLESIGPDLTAELAVRYGSPIPELSEPRGLDPLLRYLDEIAGLVRSEDDARAVAYRLAQRASESGARHIEVIFNPTHWRVHWGDRLDRLVASLDEGFAGAERDGMATAYLSASVLRTQGGDEATDLVEQVTELEMPRVVALSVDGNETDAGFTGERFAPAFALARERGLRRTVHTGESGGPDHMWDTLEHLAPERIDHGFRAVADRSLLEYLAERRIALNICPSQNLAMGWVASLDEHPVERLRLAGVPVTINTDSSWKFALADEYLASSRAFGWSAEVVRALAATSIDASFLPGERKADLREELAAYELPGHQ